MKMRQFVVLFIAGILLSCEGKNPDRYVIFLHNRFLEEHSLEEKHPLYGKVALNEIISEFEKSELNVICQKRTVNVNAREYAIGVVTQIDSLIDRGVNAKHITIVGTSKGGYIAQYVSTIARNSELNYVFIASFRESDIQDIPEINFCGDILTIYEKSDPFGVSALARKEMSSCDVKHFEEVELNTGLGHGFIFKPMKEWMIPTVLWAKGMRNLK